MSVNISRDVKAQVHMAMKCLHKAQVHPRYIARTADVTLRTCRISLVILLVIIFSVSAYTQPSSGQYTMCATEQINEVDERYVAHVDLWEEATVDEHDVLLGDVACIYADEELGERLQRVRIGSAPLLGKTHTIGSATLRLRLRQAGFDDKNIYISGSSHVDVERKAQRIDSNQVQYVIREAILQHMPEDAQVNMAIEAMGDVVVPTGDVSLRIVQLPSNVVGTSTIRVQIEVNGDPWRTVPVRVSTQISIPVWVATRHIQPGEAIVAGNNVELKHMEIKRSLRPVTLHDEVPIRANRVIREETIVEERFVELIPDVTRGQRVAVRIEHDVLNIQASGTLLEDAMIGSVVTVRNDGTDRIISGELVNRDTVVVRISR